MELDYIANVNEFGEHVVRLYNFDKSQSIKFRDLVDDSIINRKQVLDLSKVDFVNPRNCNLILGIAETDEGILPVDENVFFCALTLDGYKNMLKLLEPFCNKETKGHQYLYEIDNPTDFLFSPAGTW
ncbi:MAG: hypothetical protein ACI9P5_001331 [Saprospiraceae bacterium]|jgi:hypothetical protein|tara:strand:+ start:1211 stop:1591 length:381 start_codon:yes stop_codon:yes gene_type:complete